MYYFRIELKFCVKIISDWRYSKYLQYYWMVNTTILQFTILLNIYNTNLLSGQWCSRLKPGRPYISILTPVLWNSRPQAKQSIDFHLVMVWRNYNFYDRRISIAQHVALPSLCTFSLRKNVLKLEKQIGKGEFLFSNSSKSNILKFM